jgi:tRNA(fMet)-specific endonuclease VapC
MELLDTSAVVDIDRGGIDRKVRKLDEQGRHAVSMVTVTELRLGVALQYERGTDRHQQALDDLDDSSPGSISCRSHGQSRRPQRQSGVVRP